MYKSGSIILRHLDILRRLIKLGISSILEIREGDKGGEFVKVFKRSIYATSLFD